MDRKKLALIHIIKKDLKLSDAEYRSILMRTAGVRSSRDLTPEGFAKLMNYFVRSRHYQVNQNGLTIRQKMFIKHLLFELGWSFDHFTNFLAKYYHTKRIDTLSKKAASHLIESLKNIIGHTQENK
jgi:hypothetical protein